MPFVGGLGGLGVGAAGRPSQVPAAISVPGRPLFLSFSHSFEFDIHEISSRKET